MTWTEIFCLLLVPTGGGLLAIGRMQAARRIRKNSGLGTKTWQTRASAEAWYEGNAAAAPFSYAQGAVCIIAGLVGFIFSSPGSIVPVISIGTAVVLVLILAGFQVWRANAAAGHADKPDTPRRPGSHPSDESA